MKIYVASSWRNSYQQGVVKLLRGAGHDVYDFKNPEPGNNGFQWTEIDPEWKSWDPRAYREALKHPVAKKGYDLDMAALCGADLCVLVLPSGRSASWEAGFHFGHTGVSHVVYMPEPMEPELMYREASIAFDEDELLAAVAVVAEALSRERR